MIGTKGLGVRRLVSEEFEGVADIAGGLDFDHAQRAQNPDQGPAHELSLLDDKSANVHEVEVGPIVEAGYFLGDRNIKHALRARVFSL